MAQTYHTHPGLCKVLMWLYSGWMTRGSDVEAYVSTKTVVPDSSYTNLIGHLEYTSNDMCIFQAFVVCKD